MSVPPEIAPSEKLGRSVFSQKQAKRAARSTVPHYVFLPKEGNTCISVDRLSVAPVSEALALAEANATERCRTFCGWATVDAATARRNYRDVVVGSPIATGIHTMAISFCRTC